MPSFDERMADLMSSRLMDLDLPLGIERRVRAHLHRLNAEIASTDTDIEPFDTTDDFDLGVTLLTLVEEALDINETEIGTSYDHCTGRPIARLEHLSESTREADHFR